DRRRVLFLGRVLEVVRGGDDRVAQLAEGLRVGTVRVGRVQLLELCDVLLGDRSDVLRVRGDGVERRRRGERADPVVLVVGDGVRLLHEVLVSQLFAPAAAAAAGRQYQAERTKQYRRSTHRTNLL